MTDHENLLLSLPSERGSQLAKLVEHILTAEMLWVSGEQVPAL